MCTAATRRRIFKDLTQNCARVKRVPPRIACFPALSRGARIRHLCALLVLHASGLAGSKRREPFSKRMFEQGRE